jgi:peptidoglycan/LPS O-acetylase OafA/YrhL
MENSTPLPDWSLSLEMQFYLVLPLILISLKKIPILIIALVCALMAFASPKLFGNYLDAGTITHLGQPSFLPYRLNAFVAGMLPALFLQKNILFCSSYKNKFIYIASIALCIAPLAKPAIVAYLFFILLIYNQIPYFSKILSINLFHFLGKISYSIYLFHILVIIPVVYWLIKNPIFMYANPLTRFAAGLLITLPIIIIFSYILFILIEKNFIIFWKKSPLQYNFLKN